MKRDAGGLMRLKFCCFLLLGLTLAACKPAANANSSELNAELCRKLDACGCQSYDDCMRGAADAPGLQKPGVRECMLKSSCASLCFNVPDACINQGGGQPGTGAGGGGVGQGRSNCAAIRCSKNSDCPADCYGGCDGVRCYSF